MLRIARRTMRPRPGPSLSRRRFAAPQDEGIERFVRQSDQALSPAFPRIGESPIAERMAAQQDHAAKQSDNSPSPPKETPAAWFEAGLRLLQAGQLAQAEQCGRSALALDEAHADSLSLMGQLCAAAKRDDLAVEWFTRAIQQNPAVAD